MRSNEPRHNHLLGAERELINAFNRSNKPQMQRIARIIKDVREERGETSELPWTVEHRLERNDLLPLDEDWQNSVSV